MTILTQTKSLSAATISAAKYRKEYGDRVKTIKKVEKYQVVFLGTLEEFQEARVESIWGNTYVD